MKTLFIILCTGLLMAASPSPQEIDARAKEVGRALRCVVCQNQSIEDSEAPLAADMRRLVRVQIEQGKTNDEIINFMRVQYGDYVLLKPPVQRNTWLLWGLPLLLVLTGLIWVARLSRRRGLPETEVLSEDELTKLAAIKDRIEP